MLLPLAKLTRDLWQALVLLASNTSCFDYVDDKFTPT